MYKRIFSIIRNARTNALIAGESNNPINKSVPSYAVFSINYKKTALLFAHL